MLYVIHVMAGTETVTETLLKKHLDASCYTELFVPQYGSMRRYKGVWHHVLRALFPGYIFVGTEEPEKVFSQLKRMPKSAQIIHADVEILSVYPEEEEFLRNLMDEQYIIQMSVGILVGEELCITQGALKNYKGKVKKIDRHKRLATLSVNLFGRETPVEVGLEVVKKVSKAEFWDWKEEEQRKQYAFKKRKKKERSLVGWDSRLSDRERFGIQSEGKPVELVFIKEGIFSGLEGEVLSRTEEMVEVSVFLMGQRMKLELATKDVEDIGLENL